MNIHTQVSAGARRSTARIRLVVSTIVLVVIALTAALLAEKALGSATGPTLGPLQLRLAFNTGVAFSMGNALPAWVILVVTGLITMGIAVYGWRALPTQPGVVRCAFVAILAGAASNLIDRAIDGRVTDYFHTGWFPTFNLPDVYITGGVLLLLIGAVLTDEHDKPAGSAGASNCLG